MYSDDDDGDYGFNESDSLGDYFDDGSDNEFYEDYYEDYGEFLVEDDEDDITVDDDDDTSDGDELEHEIGSSVYTYSSEDYYDNEEDDEFILGGEEEDHTNYDDGDDNGDDEVVERSSDDDGGNTEDGHEGQQTSYFPHWHSSQFPPNVVATRQEQDSILHQRTSRTEISDKRTGDYMRKTVKESSSSGDVFKESRTGRAGIKDEYGRTSTFRTGNKGGFSEYQLIEKFRTVDFGLNKGIGNTSSGGGQNLLPPNKKK